MQTMQAQQAQQLAEQLAQLQAQLQAQQARQLRVIREELRAFLRQCGEPLDAAQEAIEEQPRRHSRPGRRGN